MTNFLRQNKTKIKSLKFVKQPVKQKDGTYVNHCFGANKEGPAAGQLVTLTPCDEEDDSHQRWVYHGTSLKLQARSCNHMAVGSVSFSSDQSYKSS